MRPLSFLPIILSCLLSACPRQNPDLASACNPGLAACTASTRLGTVSVQLHPRPISPLNPFIVEVSTAAPLDAITVSFNGRDMDMGPNMVRLLRDASGPWRGTATIPICQSGPMAWQARVELMHNGLAETLRFDFNTATR